MRGLAVMLRSGGLAGTPCRKPKPKVKEETIFERKEAKRLAKVNTWSVDHTSTR